MREDRLDLRLAERDRGDQAAGLRLEQLAHRRPTPMGVALGRPDGHARRGRDLLEREPERVLQHEHARLGLREPREAVPQVGPELGELGLAIGRAPGRHAYVLVERIVAAGAAAGGDVAAGVERRAGAATSRTRPRRGTGRSSRTASRARPAPRRAHPRDRRARGSRAARRAERDARRAPRGRERLRPWRVVREWDRSVGRRRACARAATRHRFGGGSAERVARGESTGRARPRTPALPSQQHVARQRCPGHARPSPDKGFDLTLIESLPSWDCRVCGDFLLTAVVVALVLAGGAPASAAPHRVLVASLDDDINPVSQDYLQQQVRRAERDGYDALVVELDTPGGLGTLDARDRQDVPRGDGAGRRLRQPGRLERRFRRRRDRAGRRRARDGAADEHRLLDADHDERARTSRRTSGARSSTTPPPTSPSSRGSTAATRPRPRRWCATPPTTAPGRRPRRTSSTSSRRRCPRSSSEIDGTVTKPKGLTLHTAGATRRHRRDVVLAARARHADRPEHHRPDALARRRRHPRRAVEPRPRAARDGRRDLAARRPLRPPGAARLGRGRADAAALARPLRDRRARHLPRRADARRRRHVRDRRADAVRPGRAGLPGVRSGPRSRSRARSCSCSASRSRGS